MDSVETARQELANGELSLDDRERSFRRFRAARLDVPGGFGLHLAVMILTPKFVFTAFDLAILLVAAVLESAIEQKTGVACVPVDSIQNPQAQFLPVRFAATIQPIAHEASETGVLFARFQILGRVHQTVGWQGS